MAKFALLLIFAVLAHPGYSLPLLTSNATLSCPQVTFNCSATDIQAVFRWFIDDAILAVYAYEPGQRYPLPIVSSNQTANDIVGGVNATILSASQNESSRDVVSYLSTMTVNISALLAIGVSNVKCGSFEIQGTISLMQLIAPTSPSNVQVRPLYDENFNLVSVAVQWKEVDTSNDYCIESIRYRVDLFYRNEIELNKTVGSDNCADGTCSTVLFPSSNKNYSVSVVAINFLGQSDPTPEHIVYGQDFNNSEIAFVQLTPTNGVLVAVGVVVYLIAIVIVAIFVIRKYQLGKRLNKILIGGIMIVIAFLVITFTLWVISFIVIGTLSGRRDFQTTQSGFVIFSFCFTIIFCFVPALLILAILCQQEKHKDRVEVKTSVNNKQPEQKLEELWDLPDQGKENTFVYHSNPVEERWDKTGVVLIKHYIPDGGDLLVQSKSYYCQVCKLNEHTTHCRSCGNLICSLCSQKKARFKSEKIHGYPKVASICDPCYHEICGCFMGHILLYADNQCNFEEKFMILTIRLGKLFIYSYKHQELQTYNTPLTDDKPELEIDFEDIIEACVTTKEPKILNCFEIQTAHGKDLCVSVSNTKQRNQWINSIHKTKNLTAKSGASNVLEENVSDICNRVVLTGSLTTRKRGPFAKWESCFLILTQQSLYWYKSAKDEECYNDLLLDDSFFAKKINQKHYRATADKENVFKFKVNKLNFNTFFVQAATEEEMKKWVNAILDLRRRYDFPSKDKDEDIVLSGKVTRSPNQKKKELVTITDEDIRLFKTEHDTVPIDSIPLARITSASRRDKQIEVSRVQAPSFSFVLVEEENTDEWIAIINSLIPNTTGDLKTESLNVVENPGPNTTVNVAENPGPNVTEFKVAENPTLDGTISVSENSEPDKTADEGDNLTVNSSRSDKVAKTGTGSKRTGETNYETTAEKVFKNIEEPSSISDNMHSSQEVQIPHMKDKKAQDTVENKKNTKKDSSHGLPSTSKPGSSLLPNSNEAIVPTDSTSNFEMESQSAEEFTLLDSNSVNPFLPVDFHTFETIDDKQWVPDETFDKCPQCNDDFFLGRKHHCRACHQLVCGDCSKKEVYFRKQDEKLRVCKRCYLRCNTKRTFLLYENHEPDDIISYSEMMIAFYYDYNALEFVDVIEEEKGKKYRRRFWIECNKIKEAHSINRPGDLHGIGIETKTKEHFVVFNSSALRDTWVSFINSTIVPKEAKWFDDVTAMEDKKIVYAGSVKIQHSELDWKVNFLVWTDEAVMCYESFQELNHYNSVLLSNVAAVNLKRDENNIIEVKTALPFRFRLLSKMHTDAQKVLSLILIAQAKVKTGHMETTL